MLNTIKDDLYFFKNKVAYNDSSFSHKDKNALDAIKNISTDYTGKEIQETNLPSSKKEDIKWHNIDILRRLLPNDILLITRKREF